MLPHTRDTIKKNILPPFLALFLSFGTTSLLTLATIVCMAFRILSLLLFALLTYMLYSNLLSISQARVVQGKLAFATGWWLVHAVMLVVLLVLFAQRMSLFRLPWRRQRGTRS